MDWGAFLGELGALHWLAIAGLVLGFELLTGTMYALWVAAAAAIVSVINWLGPDLAWQTDVLLFGVLSTALLLFGHYVIKPRLREEAAVGLNEPAHALVGRRARAIADFRTGEGRVKMGDTEWRASSDDMIEAGEELVVVSVEGSTLKVVARED